MKLALIALALVAATALAIVFTQTGERRVSLVIVNGTVVTMDGAGRVIANGGVAVDGSDIVAVDTAEAIERQFAGAERLDAAGQVVMPGLINTHTHAPMVLCRGLADDRALMEWLTKYIFPAEAKTVSPEFVRAGTRLAALEMIQSGTPPTPTCITSRRRLPGKPGQPGCAACSDKPSFSFPSPTHAPLPRP